MSFSASDSVMNISQKYVIEDVIGYGSFGKVKLGTHIATGEKVAIKIIEKSTEKNIFCEISILKAISHPNILEVYEIIETSTNFYIISEYINGGELFGYIQKKTRLNQNEISLFFFQMVNSLDYLHSHNIVHRDLKPENIMLTKEKILKLIDFGMAITTTNFLSTKCGSLSYSSPEMLKGERYDGKAADIWSLGVILYVMVCGCYPFEDKNEANLIKKIIKGKVNYFHFIPFIIKDLLMKILVVNPNKRMSIKEIKEHSLYKHGKTIYLKENCIYESNKYFIRQDIIAKANEILEEKEKEKILDDISKKIYINKIIKTTNWRLFSSKPVNNKVKKSSKSDTKKLSKNEKNSTSISTKVLVPEVMKKRIKSMSKGDYGNYSYRRKLPSKTISDRQLSVETKNKSFSLTNLNGPRKKSEICKSLKLFSSHPMHKVIILNDDKKKKLKNSNSHNSQELSKRPQKNTRIISVRFINNKKPNNTSGNISTHVLKKKSNLSHISSYKKRNRNDKHSQISKNESNIKLTCGSLNEDN